MVPRTLCSGCGSCAAICPKNCITMTADAEGFRYPVIDEAGCIRCGACQRVCPVENHPALSGHTTALAAQNANEALRRESSSGGVFSALAEKILSQGGWVCAAVYDDRFGVCHELTDSPERLAAMRGAKYTQSRAEQCFPRIRELLKRDIPVLFVGTPCQCAGLQSFLGQDFARLLVADMVCHGVPSPKVWQRYLQERQQIDAPDGKLLSVNLRSKSTGWSRYGYSVEYTYNGSVSHCTPQGQDPFMRGFVSNLYLRPSCADCTSKGVQRCSDLTLGDYWGIWDQHPEFDDDRGTSLLLVHTDRGEQIWAQLAAGFRVCSVTCEDALARNPSALQSSAPHTNREHFFKQLDQKASVIQWIDSCLVPKQPSLLRRLLGRLRQK